MVWLDVRQFRRQWVRTGAPVFLGGLLVLAFAPCNSVAVDYHTQIAPLLTKYCAGCHNRQDSEGELSLQDFGDLMKGGANGPVVVSGASEKSLLWQLVSASQEPRMPPAGEPQLDEAALALIKAWIDQGAAAGDPGASEDVDDGRESVLPSAAPKPITALACSQDGRWLAQARFKTVELSTARGQLVHLLAGHPGKVNSLAFSADGSRLFVATGSAGQSGEAWCWDTKTGRRMFQLGGHHDILYAAEPSPDGRFLATAGYDRQVRVWDLSNQQLLHVLEGHNGPVFDLAFTTDGEVLATASADATVKIWALQTGERLDTLNQPLQEQLSVDISPNGNLVIAAGADNRIRVWNLISLDKPRINPLLIARFAHEQPVLRVRYAPSGQIVASSSRDGTLKFWDAATMRQLESHPQGDDVAAKFDFSADGTRLHVVRMDGTSQIYAVPAPDAGGTGGGIAEHHNLSLADSVARPVPNSGHHDAWNEVDESEPNDRPTETALHSLPLQARGTIQAAGTAPSDRDCFRFRADAGQTWMVEIDAARSGSQLDSFVQILDADGNPVPRVVLRSVRDSYFTFRGKDSIQTGDFRVHNWQEMQLNQLLYCGGEVVKLYHYPRGPDSGFNVYPNFGQRHGFFDTTPTTHALHEPCYIVEPYPPGAEFAANGLPTFVIPFENDDESRGRWGADSRLTFTAPESGEYVCVVQDVRQLAGESFHYTLRIRPARPDFQPKLIDAERKVPQGSGQRFGVEIEREDDFDGPVQIEVLNVPDALSVTSPLTVEAGHLQAFGVIVANPDAPVSEDVQWELPVVATATIQGHKVRHDVGVLPVRIVPEPNVRVEFLGQDRDAQGYGAPEITLEAGGTATAQIRIQRNGFDGRVEFGKEDAVIGGPHGVFVTDTGLNGVLVRENELERVVVIQAEPWVAPGEYQVFVQASTAGSPASPPILLRIIAPGGNRQAANIQARSAALD